MDGQATNNNSNNKTAILVVFAIIALIIVFGVFLYIRHTKFYISTDDAYVTGKIHSVAPKVSGTVKKVYVEDNQMVKSGDLLVELDSRDYDVKVEDAKAALDAEQSKLKEQGDRIDVAEKMISEIQARIDAEKAVLALQEANLRQAGDDFRRAKKLYEKGAFAEATLEKATTAYDVARAQVNAAQEQIKQGISSLETQKLVVSQSKTAYRSQGYVLEQKKQVYAASKLMQSYTRIYAPSDGHITKKNIEVGNQVQPGQPLMAVVSLDISNVWIVANYKETQLERVRPGQKVEIKVDTYPGRTFTGTVDSIMAGTGSVFSLFPPENATGNYVKVVQRIPVKIVLSKNTDPGHMLRVGMSVEPTISAK